MSQTRLVAAKSAAKPAKLAAAPKARPSTTPPPFAKTKSAAPSPSRPSKPPPAATAEERPTKGGQTKNELKAQFAKLSGATAQIASLKRSINKGFYEIGGLLTQIRNEKLYEVKGYGSFEAFVEREIDINKATCLKMIRIAEALRQDQALAAGLERAAAAVAALDGEVEVSTQARPGGSPLGGIPLHKQ
jgi:hypothetical protein